MKCRPPEPSRPRNPIQEEAWRNRKYDDLGTDEAMRRLSDKANEMQRAGCSICADHLDRVRETL